MSARLSRARLPSIASNGLIMLFVALYSVNVVLALTIVSGFVAGFDARAAAPSPPPAAPSKERPATLETVPGNPNKRVVLSAKAAERIDVQLGTVAEQTIVTTQMFGGMVIEASNAGAQSATRKSAASKNPLWVRIGVSPSEFGRLDKTRPARILPLQTRADVMADIVATPVESQQQESSKSGMVPLYFAIPGTPAGLAVGMRVRAELALEGGGESRKTVPYSAVYYDAKGDAWVYVATSPLAFIRERVQVERVAGNFALLAGTSGPAIGTQVVTVGVSLLYGVEVFGK